MTKLTSTADVWRSAWWIFYVMAVAASVAGAALSGCIQPQTLYGNVYQCPIDLLKSVEAKLDCQTAQ